MMPPNEQDWARDRDRFAADPVSRDHGFPLGPLAQQFATLTYSLLGFQKLATHAEQRLYATRSYSLSKPPRTGRRLIRL